MWPRRLPSASLLLVAAAAASCTAVEVKESSLGFTISTSWDGRPLPEPHTRVWLRPAKGGLFIDVEARLYNDPPRPKAPAGPYMFMWRSEAVEVYFANEDNQYVEVELGPWGHHNTLLLENVRQYTRSQLPLRYSANVDHKTHTWFGTAFLPLEYLPSNVTKFNAFALHGSCEDRKYDSLYPAPAGALKQADFHQLRYFKNIDLTRLGVEVPTDLSKVWTDAMYGKTAQRYQINSTWDGKPLGHNPTTVTLQKGHDGYALLAVFAPYYDDPAPDAEPGQSLWGLWNYEVVEVYFANEEGHMLQVILGPHGQHLVILLDGEYNDVERNLPLDFYSTYVARGSGTWYGSARIPLGYFPVGTRKFNAFATHGTGPYADRWFEALHPVPGARPRYHNLKYMRPIDVGSLVPGNDRPSKLWRTALAKSGGSK